MKKVKVTILLMLAVVIATSSVMPVSAAKKYSYQKTTKRKYVMVDGKKIGGDFHYQLVKIKGKSKTKNKINKTLKKDYNKFVKTHWNDFKRCCVTTYNSSFPSGAKDYMCKTDAKVTFNKGNYFSVKKTCNWFAGGVHNIDEFGTVFSKKTGKQLSLSSFVKGNKKQINNKIKKAFLKKVSGTVSQYPRQIEIIKNHKIKDYPIYITSKKVYICFKCYELEMGNGNMVISLKRK